LKKKETAGDFTERVLGMIIQSSHPVACLHMDLCMSIFNKFSHKEYRRIMFVRPLKKVKVLFSDIYLIGLSSRLSRALL
jgi:hypothetical protein